MKAKIRVYGKDQNRTALGIVNAYLKLYPNATLADLQAAFPYTLNPAVASVKETIAPASEIAANPGDFFEKPEDLITLKDGQKLTLKYLWEKSYYDRIEEHAKQFGIEVAKITETAPFREGSYRLELIEDKPAAAPYIRPQAGKAVLDTTPEKKKNNWWWWLLLLLLLLLALLLWKKCNHDKAVAVPATEVVPFTETDKVDVYAPLRDKKLAEATVSEAGDLIFNKAGNLIGIVINADTIKFDELSTEAEVYKFLHSDALESGWLVMDDVHFKFNEVNFSPAALAQIQNIASLLKTHAPAARIALEGFSDHIGTDKENQTISDERAVATKGHFVTDGFPEGQVTSAEGLKDTQRLCQADDTPLCRALNRRVEIKITK
jgi:outer membrane protein OmpA-like peptidoglycan-associated protein